MASTRRTARAATVETRAPDPALQTLADGLPGNVGLGTSIWSYPGRAGIVWDRAYSETLLAKHGLTAYAQHPLLHTVCVDRAFYRPLNASQYARLAAMVPPEFRFVVKAPSLVTDALVRGEEGRGRQANPTFLNAVIAVREFVQPAIEGLGTKIGALVFQLSPLPLPMLAQWADVLARLAAMLRALPSLRDVAPDGVIAVEVRDAALLARHGGCRVARLRHNQQQGRGIGTVERVRACRGAAATLKQPGPRRLKKRSAEALLIHSHSIVAGGLLLTS